MEAEDPLASYLKDVRKAPSKKCHVCNNKQAREYIERICEMKEREDPSAAGMTISRFREEFLIGRLGLNISIHSCNRHIRECLLRDVTTGKLR